MVLLIVLYVPFKDDISLAATVVIASFSAVTEIVIAVEDFKFGSCTTFKALRLDSFIEPRVP